MTCCDIYLEEKEMMSSVILFKARCHRTAGHDKYNTLKCSVDIKIFPNC